VFLIPHDLPCTNKLRIHATGKCYVVNLPAHISGDIFPHPLFDLAVACAVACQTNHTDHRRHPRSGLPFPASIVIAFLVVPKR
jgi:hypothetical protein